jgi:3-methyladenine DNA glycosylase/8-oxoguanine DNA glycosylase
MNINLAARPPFNLHSVIFSHGWHQMEPFRVEADGKLFSTVTRISNGKVIELVIREAPGGVDVEIADPVTEEEQSEIAQIVTWMLGLDQDFSNFYALAREEPKLRSAALQAKGRILRSPNLFDDILKTILTTNTLWAATKRMNKNLIDQFGERLPADPARHAFPTPDRLAETDEATLRSATRLGYRAPYVLSLARRVASGEREIESLKGCDLPTPELRKRLLEIKGVGPYAAANLLMLLGRYDAIPVDSWAMKMVSNEWHNGAPVGRAEVDAAFSRWGDWKGLAYWLWEWNR